MDLQAIQQYLDQNKETDEVKAFLGKLSSPSMDVVKGFLESNEDGKKYLQSFADGKVTKGIDTWKANNLQKLIDDAVKSANPQETPEQKRLRELEAKIAQAEAQASRSELKSKATAYATQKGVPVDIIEYLLGEDEQASTANIDKVKALLDAAIQKSVDEKFKEKGYTPNIDTLDYKGVNPWKKETFNLTQQAKILSENPQLAEQLQKQAKL